MTKADCVPFICCLHLMRLRARDPDALAHYGAVWLTTPAGERKQIAELTAEDRVEIDDYLNLYFEDVTEAVDEFGVERVDVDDTELDERTT